MSSLISNKKVVTENKLIQFLSFDYLYNRKVVNIKQITTCQLLMDKDQRSICPSLQENQETESSHHKREKKIRLMSLGRKVPIYCIINLVNTHKHSRLITSKSTARNEGQYITGYLQSLSEFESLIYLCFNVRRL